jgi:hypothetical protein
VSLDQALYANGMKDTEEKGDSSDVALRFNTGKPEVHYILFYPEFLAALAEVQAQGGRKYGYGNWTAGGKPNSEYYDAAIRHLLSHFNGEIYDDDLGTRHLVQAIWNLMQVLEQNGDGGPHIDPEFDQAAFEEKWASFPKKALKEK